jgi:hypothetical protein
MYLCWTHVRWVTGLRSSPVKVYLLAYNFIVPAYREDNTTDTWAYMGHNMKRWKEQWGKSRLSHFKKLEVLLESCRFALLSGDTFRKHGLQYCAM